MVQGLHRGVIVAFAYVVIAACFAVLLVQVARDWKEPQTKCEGEPER